MEDEGSVGEQSHEEEQRGAEIAPQFLHRLIVYKIATFTFGNTSTSTRMLHTPAHLYLTHPVNPICEPNECVKVAKVMKIETSMLGILDTPSRTFPDQMAILKLTRELEAGSEFRAITCITRI